MNSNNYNNNNNNPFCIFMFIPHCPALLNIVLYNTSYCRRGRLNKRSCPPWRVSMTL